MQLDHLFYFVMLADAGSFYGAARKTYLSHQGLNRAVSALEAELGVKLLERSSRGVRLSTRGEIFYDYAKTALAHYDTMLDDLYAEHRLASEDGSPLVFHLTYYASQVSRPLVEGMGVMGAVSLAEEGFARIVEGASQSDGSDLFLADLNCETEKMISAHEDVIFEPVLVSQFGLAWKEGSPFERQRVIHREQLENFPLAMDSHREMLKLTEVIMEEYPLNNVRLGVAEPRTTLQYATTSNQVAATFDSFGFELMQANPSFAAANLHFTPLATPRSMCRIGFLYAKNAKPGIRARHAIDRLKLHLQERYASYYARYPVL